MRGAHVCTCGVTVSITIKDIAREAGVSHSTVSRALRDSPLIPPLTSQRVHRAAAKLGYLPSAAARTLKTNRSRVLGVIISNVDDPFFSEVLQGIEEVAQAANYSLFMAASRRDPQHEHQIIRTMHEHRVDGIILCSTLSSIEQNGQLAAVGAPIIVINSQACEEYQYTIEHDDLDGARRMTRHLIELGHRRIGYLGFPGSGRSDSKRLGGYRLAMGQAGLIILDGYEFAAFDNDPARGSAAAGHFLALTERPTAILCYNDQIAIGLLQGLQHGGLRIPQDCSIAGFDNITFSAYTNPPLTTFDQPKRSIGAEAARMTLRLLNEAGSVPGAKRVVMQGHLVARASTAPPPREMS